MIKFTILFYNSINPSAIIHSFYQIPLGILEHYSRSLIKIVKWKINKKSQIVYIPIDSKNSFVKTNSLKTYHLTFPDCLINLVKTTSFEPNRNTLRIIKHFLLQDDFTSTITLSGPSDDESNWSDGTIRFINNMWDGILKFESEYFGKSLYSHSISKSINDCHLQVDPLTMSHQYNYELDIHENLRSYSSVTQEEYDNIKMLKKIGFIKDGNFFIWYDRVILYEPQGLAYGDYIRNRSDIFYLSGEKFTKRERIGKNEIFSKVDNNFKLFK